MSGLLRIVVNGREVVNTEKDYFRATVGWQPRSLAGRLVVVFKGFSGGFWYQCSECECYCTGNITRPRSPFFESQQHTTYFT